MIIILLISLAVLVSIVLFAFTFATFTTYGWWIPEHHLDSFLEKNLTKYKLNSFDSGILSAFEGNLPYISILPFDLFAKWQINDVGTIPRWSKWSKALDDRRFQLLTQ